MISRSGKGVFSESTVSACSLTVSVHPYVCAIACINMFAHVKDSVVYVSSVGYGNTETSSTHRRFGNATLLQLAFSVETARISHGRNPNGTIQLLKKKRLENVNQC